MKLNQDNLNVLRKIKKENNLTQRELAKDLGFSLGKLNYVLKGLQNKGLVKLENFRKQKNKISYLRYVLTPKGITVRTKLTLSFMKKKIEEYDELKKEIEQNVDDYKI